MKSCKNCVTQLRDTDNYCQICGAKVIRNRLTMKNLWQDFSERFLNYDNVFFKTVRHMFSKPEVVIEDYIQGVRKKYMNVFNYFTISLTISGFLNFIFLKFYPQVFTDAMDVFNASQNTGKQAFDNIMSSIFEYQTFFFFMIIPLLALISKIVFYDYKTYNYTEHTVIYLYTYSHLIALTNIAYFLCLLVYKPFLSVLVMISMPINILYVAIVLKRLFHLNVKELIVKTLVFVAVGSIFYIVFILLFTILVVAVLYFDGSLQEMIHQVN